MSLRVLYLEKIKQADEEERQTEVYHWARLISAKEWKELMEMGMQDEYKQEVVKEMERINADRALRYQYITREIQQMDRNSMQDDWLQQGIQQGMQQGMRQGIQGAIDMLRKLGYQEEKIKSSIMEGYQLFQRHILYLLRSSLLLDSRWLEQVIEGRHLDFSCAAPHAHITSLVKAA